jgi:hypothetical protein
VALVFCEFENLCGVLQYHRIATELGGHGIHVRLRSYYTFNDFDFEQRRTQIFNHYSFGTLATGQLDSIWGYEIGETWKFWGCDVWTDFDRDFATVCVGGAD